MIVVLVTFDVAPADRVAFVASRTQQVETSRAEAGCLEYAFCYDAVEPGRVRLIEQWQDQGSLDAHLAAIAAAGGPDASVEVLGRTVMVIDGEPAGPG